MASRIRRLRLQFRNVVAADIYSSIDTEQSLGVRIVWRGMVGRALSRRVRVQVVPTDAFRPLAEADRGAGGKGAGRPARPSRH